MLRNRSTQSVLLGTLMVLVLAACATSPYRAADGRGFGYSERQLSDDQYRVHFRVMGDNTSQALDYAMLRASELTLMNGYDWFDIGSRDTLVDKQPVAQDLTTAVGFGTDLREVEVIMEIRMGKGIRPDGSVSYDARGLHGRLSQGI